MESLPAADLDLWFGSADGRGASSLGRSAHDHALIEALSLLPHRQHCSREFPRHTEARHLRSHPSGYQLVVVLFIDPATTRMGRGTLEHLEFIHLPEEQLRPQPPAGILLLLDPTLPLA